MAVCVCGEQERIQLYCLIILIELNMVQVREVAKPSIETSRNMVGPLYVIHDGSDLVLKQPAQHDLTHSIVKGNECRRSRLGSELNCY